MEAAERIEPDDPRPPITPTDLIELYATRGKPSEVEPRLQQELAIAEHTQGAAHPHVAVVLHRLAKRHHRLGEYAAADSFYRRALASMTRRWDQPTPILW